MDRQEQLENEFWNAVSFQTGEGREFVDDSLSYFRSEARGVLGSFFFAIN